MDFMRAPLRLRMILLMLLSLTLPGATRLTFAQTVEIRDFAEFYLGLTAPPELILEAREAGNLLHTGK